MSYIPKLKFWWKKFRFSKILEGEAQKTTIFGILASKSTFWSIAPKVFILATWSPQPFWKKTKWALLIYTKFKVYSLTGSQDILKNIRRVRVFQILFKKGYVDFFTQVHSFWDEWEKQHDGKKHKSQSVFSSHVDFPTYLKNYALEQKIPEHGCTKPNPGKFS